MYDETRTDLRNKRQRIDDAQVALDRAHADLAAQKGKQMRLLADVSEQNQRVESCAQVIGKAESDMLEALAFRDEPAPVVVAAKVSAESGDRDLDQDDEHLFGEQPAAAAATV